MYDVEGVLQTVQAYIGTTMFLWAFLVCLIYGFCYGKESLRKRLAFVFILSILFVFNDLSMKLMGKVTDPATYYRFIWAVPILPLIAWTGTKVVMERQKRWERAVVLLMLFCLFWGGKSSYVTKESIRIPENKYNLSNDVLEVCDIIAKDKKKERPVVAFDLACQMQSRLYDPSLIWGISRNAYQFHNNMEGYENTGRHKSEKILIHAVNYGVKNEEELLARAVKRKKIDYIVTLAEYEMDAYLGQLGFELVGSTDARSVYVRK